MNTEIICPGIDEYMKPFLGYFHRSESRELAECQRRPDNVLGEAV